jgi:hypothetical protein
LNELPLFDVDVAAGRAKLKLAEGTAQRVFLVFAEVLDVAWWRRIWLIQEAVLPSLAKVMLGPISMPWEVFAIAVLYLQRHMKCCREWFRRFPELANVFERFTVHRYGNWVDQARRIQESVKHPLHHFLWHYRCHNATDPRDKVHALLSFLGEEENLGELAPNYALSKKEVFKMLSCTMCAPAENSAFFRDEDKTYRHRRTCHHGSTTGAPPLIQLSGLTSARGCVIVPIKPLAMSLPQLCATITMGLISMGFSLTLCVLFVPRYRETT